ncbi:peptidase S8 subtilisin-related protein [Fadolivirus algeromassiliense]|jgi:hypothetical protein|uniref:Peptidase S8 subtilisin-related protein n=1 Tax=Fadolivirus FV1/VV64 TaxID=3070911 RepID=A0A7D3R1P0_9VIRU|nr:peptidase S8 subtilisin-related protein [Fadolivirus algeromassiliense]QKF94481.1 peptidase S8 subtilisin-related protein [Fadolivirus FV1/VV64]
MENLQELIIYQIKEILTNKNQNLDDYSFEIGDNEIIVRRGSHYVKISYKKFKACCITDKSKKWIKYLEKQIHKIIKCYHEETQDNNHNDNQDNNQVNQITDRWIITMKNTRSLDLIKCPSSVHQMNRYRNVMNGFSCTGTENDIKKMMNDNPDIEGYVKDEIAQAAVLKDSLRVLRATNLSQTIGGFISRIGVNRSSRKAGTRTPLVPLDTNVVVFVVDTGIDATHQDLNVDATNSRNFINANPADWNDQNGHGTHVAGIIGAKDNTAGIVGVAPGVRVAAIRVLDANGSGYYSQIIAGLDYILQVKNTNPSIRAIVNMSLGGPGNTAFDTAVRRVVSGNIPVVVAAGNEGKNASTTSPARVVEAITVGAYNSSNNIMASWSNFGSLVDVLAPGVNIDSTYFGNRYAVLSGTSMASPMVAGAIACFMTTNPTVSSQLAIRNAIVNDSKLLTITNYDKTISTNPNISLTSRQRTSGTPNRSVYVGKY